MIKSYKIEGRNVELEFDNCIIKGHLSDEILPKIYGNEIVLFFEGFYSAIHIKSSDLNEDDFDIILCEIVNYYSCFHGMLRPKEIFTIQEYMNFVNKIEKEKANDSKILRELSILEDNIKRAESNVEMLKESTKVTFVFSADGYNDLWLNSDDNKVLKYLYKYFNKKLDLLRSDRINKVNEIINK